MLGQKPQKSAEIEKQSLSEMVETFKERRREMYLDMIKKGEINVSEKSIKIVQHPKYRKQQQGECLY